MRAKLFGGDDAYSLAEMLEDVRSGVWSELSSHSAIDVYRRNLQRAYLHAAHQLMESEDEEVIGTDIQAMIRGELRTLLNDVESAASGTADRATRLHLEDIQERITNILED